MICLARLSIILFNLNGCELLINWRMTCQHSEKGLPWLKAWFMGTFNPENVYLCGERSILISVSSYKVEKVHSYLLLVPNICVSLDFPCSSFGYCVRLCMWDEYTIYTPRHSLRKKCSYHLGGMMLTVASWLPQSEIQMWMYPEVAYVSHLLY